MKTKRHLLNVIVAFLFLSITNIAFANKQKVYWLKDLSIQELQEQLQGLPQEKREEKILTLIKNGNLAEVTPELAKKLHILWVGDDKNNLTQTISINQRRSNLNSDLTIEPPSPPSSLQATLPRLVIARMLFLSDTTEREYGLFTLDHIRNGSTITPYTDYSPHLIHHVHSAGSFIQNLPTIDEVENFQFRNGSALGNIATANARLNIATQGLHSIIAIRDIEPLEQVGLRTYHPAELFTNNGRVIYRGDYIDTGARRHTHPGTFAQHNDTEWDNQDMTDALRRMNFQLSQ